MKIQTTEYDDAVVIKLTGEMMLGYEAKEFQDAIKSSLDKNIKKFVVDLGNLRFISSWGIGILIHGYTTTINKQGKFVLASVPDKVNEVICTTKLDSVFEMFNTVEEALGE